MTSEEWKAFEKFRTDFKEKVEEWKIFSDEIKELAKEASCKDTPPYPIENALVYNTALDLIEESDDIKLIVIGDNPGKNEQLNVNQKYLVGQAGKIASGFFSRNPELSLDFRKNTIILNKSPVHTAKTSHLKYLQKKAGPELQNFLIESQVWMAEKTALLHKSLKNSKIYLVGYAELKKKGIFKEYRESFLASCTDKKDFDRVYLFQHFSMNCFTKDLKNFQEKNKGLPLEKALEELGHFHRDEIFSQGAFNN